MAANRTQLYNYAGGKCAFCGRDVRESLKRYGTHHGQFEFNHLDPQRKDSDYDNLIRRNLSSSQLDEIDKCVLLCRNCHGLYHAQDLSAKATIKLQVGDRRRQQTYRARGIFDFQEKHVALFSDQNNELECFYIELRGQPPLLRLRRELEKELFPHFIPQTRACRELLVRGIDRTPLLKVTRSTQNHFRMRMDVRFTLAELELHGEPGEPIVWVRNGKMLTADGEVRRRGIVTMEGIEYAVCNKEQTA
jgi:hypothetical protein